MPSSNHSGQQLVRDRVLVMVKGAREGRLTLELLAGAGIRGTLVASVAELGLRIEQGAAAALVAEELLTADAAQELQALLRRQPPWSDFPLVVFGATGSSDETRDSALAALGNVTVLDRPVHVRSMIAAVNAALRSRSRQYEARRAIESRENFIAMLGHELRNPLGAITFAATVLAKKSATLPNELAIVQRQARHLARLINDLLDVARVTHGKLTLTRERLNLVEIARHAFETLEGQAREQCLRYELLVAESSLELEGDRQRLEQAFNNLLTNAMKYTPRDGRVTLSLARELDQAVICVRDSGIGLAPDMLDRVFDPFAQADVSLDRAQGGLGLGLSLVRSIVQLHGGHVEASSRGLGRGSSFYVRLPCLPAPAAAVSDVSGSASSAPCSKRIVVVEDNADIREVFALLLQQAGHQVCCAEDGPNGLSQILTFAPDIAFVDVGLPGFDGLEVARRARASGSRAHLIAVTGYGQAEDKRRSAEAGFNDHLVKPALDAEIQNAILRASTCG
jgi:signal transduction histidine kinase/CheY-like chemotaxis protein